MQNLPIKEIIIITAYLSKNRGIGFEGQLPWENIEADMTNFKARTMGHSVIMGKDTLASRNGRALSHRQNIVVSNSLTSDTVSQGILIAKSLNEAIAMATGEKIFLIGGVRIYKEAIDNDIANTIMATIIHEDFECDRFFPEIPNNWAIIQEGAKGMDPGSELTIQFVTLKNKRNPFPLGVTS